MPSSRGGTELNRGRGGGEGSGGEDGPKEKKQRPPTVPSRVCSFCLYEEEEGKELNEWDRRRGRAAAAVSGFKFRIPRGTEGRWAGGGGEERATVNIKLNVTMNFFFMQSVNIISH
jgi:hypothetical protein